MKFIPKYITTDVLAEYGEHLTHEAYNEMVKLNSTQGDYNTMILNQLFNTDEGIQIPYLQNTINEIKTDQERLDNDMDDIIAEMIRIKGSLSKYTTFCDVRRMITESTQGFVKVNKLKAGENIDIVVDALNNVTISATSDVTKQYVDEHDILTLQESKAYTDDVIAQIDLSDYATIQYVDDAIAQIDLSDYATIQYVDDAIAAIPIPVVPTNVSAFINDVGYITSHDIPPVVESDPYFSASPAAGITSQDITDWNNKLSVETDPIFGASAAAGIQATDITAWNNKSDFSGNYNDLTNKPDLTISSILIAQGNDSRINLGVLERGFYDVSSYGEIIATPDGVSGYSLGQPHEYLIVTKKYADAAVNETFAYFIGCSNVTNSNTSLSYGPRIQEIYKTSNGLNKRNMKNQTTLNNIDITTVAQTITAKKTFNVLPESSIVPTTNNQLVNKAYVDGAIPTVPTNVSAFTNDAGYITGYTETDPVFLASIATQTTQTAGKVYDVTYINTMLGNIEALLGGI